MKILLTLFMLILNVQFILGYNTEGHITILNDDSTLRVATVRLYTLDNLGTPCREGTSYSNNAGGWPNNANFAFDTGGDLDPKAQWTDSNKVSAGTYYLRIDDKYVVLTILNEICGDFGLKYQFQNFSIIFRLLPDSVRVSETRDWVAQPVTFYQKLQDGVTDTGTVALWNGDAFYPRYNAPHTYTLIGTEAYTFHADTNIYSNQKFHDWSGYDDIQNFYEILGDLSIQANLFSIDNGIIIKTDLISANGDSSGFVKFKDPWLIDYADSLYGNNKRNRGMKTDDDDALIFKERTSPFYPDYSTNYNGDVYKGVFLNQEISDNKP